MIGTLGCFRFIYGYFVKGEVKTNAILHKSGSRSTNEGHPYNTAQSKPVPL